MSDICPICEEMHFLLDGGETLENVALRIGKARTTLLKHRRLCRPGNVIGPQGARPQEFCGRGHDMSVYGKEQSWGRGRFCCECRRMRDRVWRKLPRDGTPEQMDDYQKQMSTGLGEWMRKVRGGMTQEEFGQLVGMTRLAVSMTERGVRRMRVDEMTLICARFAEPLPVFPRMLS